MNLVVQRIGSIINHRPGKIINLNTLLTAKMLNSRFSVNKLLITMYNFAFRMLNIVDLIGLIVNTNNLVEESKNQEYILLNHNVQLVC